MTFVEFARLHGLRPGRVLPDGRWRRCATERHPQKRNGAYMLLPDGRVGFVRDWARDFEPAVWRPEGETEAPAFDPAAHARAWEERRLERKVASGEAREFYAQCAPLRGGHPYLDSHGLDLMTGCRGLRVDEDGWLVVPARKGGRLVSVQRIAPDGDKRFWSRAPMQDAAFEITRRDAPITVYCEGLATGIAIYQAAPLTRVVVTFYASNLERLEHTRPGLVVVAADNDHGTEAKVGENPGLKAAQSAAERIGCGVAYPTGIEGTDWCDWRQENLAAQKEQRRAHETDAALQAIVDARLAAEITRSAKYLKPKENS